MMMMMKCGVIFRGVQHGKATKSTSKGSISTTRDSRHIHKQNHNHKHNHARHARMPLASLSRARHAVRMRVCSRAFAQSLGTVQYTQHIAPFPVACEGQRTIAHQ